MANFADLLNSPLPSKVAAMQESTENIENEAVITESDDATVVMQVDPVEVPAEPVSVPVPAEAPVAPVANPEEIVAIAPVEDLTPEEDRNVDDVLNAVGTSVILNKEMNEDEYKEFVNGLDGGIAEAEGFLTERTVVRSDKNARKAQLYEVAIAAVAREKGDRDWKKLETVYKMERKLKARLRKKYHNLAMKKVKEYLDRAKRSKSGILARLASKIHGN